MNTSTVLYFPETTIIRKDLCSLLCFFERVSSYQPAENDPALSSDIFCEKGLCQSYAPAPLGEALPRFQQLIKDLSVHHDEYYGGYLSSLSAGKNYDIDETSVRGLIDQLHQTDQKTKELGKQEDRAEKKLWSARIFLKLAGILQKNEEEIKQELINAASRNSDLLHDLQGEADFADSRELAALLPLPDISAPGPKINQEQLLFAWRQLFLRDTLNYQFLTTGNQEAAEIIFEIYENHFQTKPVELIAISLPAFTQSEMEIDNLCLDKINTIKKEFTANRQNISTILTDLLTTEPNEKILKKLAAEETAWNSKFAAQQEKIGLYFYLLADTSLEELMQQLTRSGEDNKKENGKTKHTIIAVLKQMNFTL
ncbi:MAG: hypothetical protein KKB30_16115 [Proteobacteria bacterium]|nr:hypothetical protein [Pseudomonadota bacterium]MBU1713978.1 hypothetical protein [Pseudomonadota bacterium]